jgi:predicted lipoprotein with Yx(FWY)xxD motif
MKRTSLFLVAGLLALAGCSDDEDSSASKQSPTNDDAVVKKEQATKTKDDATAKDPTAPATAKGTTITLHDSQFGAMLFDSEKQAIYIFQRDRNQQTICYGECAEAWPPVLTNGKPNAGRGVRQSLLGTIKRRDGKQQVTYAGKPLYFYAHEQPGEVRCHNVDLNGGLWWVVGPDGKRRA